MNKGFYNLASGMITQNRNLNVISNNMANVSTPGFKKDTFLSSTFKEEMVARTGNIDKKNPTQLGASSQIRMAELTATAFGQGALEETGLALDVALLSEGFFQIQTYTGEVGYTRNGSFILDDQGYLSLQNVGRVMGVNGPIQLSSDQINIDTYGNITDKSGNFIDKLGVVDFLDYTQITKNDNGLFTGAQGFPVAAQMVQGQVERSNVSALDEMTAMMSSQRALQSAAQVLKMHDQIMAKAVTEIGRV